MLPDTAQSAGSPRHPLERQWLIELPPWHKSFLKNVWEWLNPRPQPRWPRRVPGVAIYRAPAIELELQPWHRGFLGLVRELLRRKRPEPPLEVTAQPVEVADLWEMKAYTQQFQRTQAVSLTLHALLLLLIAIPVAQQVVPAKVPTILELSPLADISPYQLALPPSDKEGGGGGGGGERNPLPASKGRLPRQAMLQLTPPVAVIRNPHPKLAAEPTIIVPPDITIPQPDVAQYGDPLSRATILSGGPGSGGGIGTGAGGGVGSGRGPGVGPGWGGGIGGGVFRIGGSVLAPGCLYGCNERCASYAACPEYSEAARKAKYQGVVVVWVIVGADGRIVPSSVRVVKSLGMGLDEEAVRAVLQWRFAPATRFGKPVPVQMAVEVDFRLL